MYRALSIGIAAVAALMLLLGQGPSPAEAATTIYVTSNADSGPGTFRAAASQASSNPEVNVIKFLTSGPVNLQSQVLYTGSQSLTISGLLKTVIQGNTCNDGESALLLSTSGGDLTLLNLTFQNNPCGHGVWVILPGADRTVSITLNGVLMKNNSGRGFQVTEDYEECANRPASINLTVLYSSFTGNDLDGLWAREYGDRGLTATVRFSHFRDNGGNGLSLAEGCDGDLTLNALSSTFNDNGYELEANGLAVTESGGGAATANLTALDASRNAGHGVVFWEDDGAGDASLDAADSDPGVASCPGGGDLRLTIAGGRANGNGRNGAHGIDVNEGDCGTLYATFSAFVASDNGDRGINAEETGGGNLVVRASGTQTSNNGRYYPDGVGIRMSEDDHGSIDAELTAYTATANGSESNGVSAVENGEGDLRLVVKSSTILANWTGVFIRERDCGDLDASFSLSGVNLNLSHGIEATQDACDGDDDGELTLTATTVFGNGDGDLDLSGVVLN